MLFPNDSAKISLVHSCSCLYYIPCGCKNLVQFPLVYQLAWVPSDVWNKWSPFFLIKPTSPEKQSLSFVKRSSYNITSVYSVMSCIRYDYISLVVILKIPLFLEPSFKAHFTSISGSTNVSTKTMINKHPLNVLSLISTTLYFWVTDT